MTKVLQIGGKAKVGVSVEAIRVLRTRNLVPLAVVVGQDAESVLLTRLLLEDFGGLLERGSHLEPSGLLAQEHDHLVAFEVVVKGLFWPVHQELLEAVAQHEVSNAVVNELVALVLVRRLLVDVLTCFDGGLEVVVKDGSGQKQLTVSDQSELTEGHHFELISDLRAEGDESLLQRVAVEVHFLSVSHSLFLLGTCLGEVGQNVELVGLGEWLA